MRTSSLTPEETIERASGGGIFEVGSDYEKYSVASANKFIQYIGKKPVVDLGSGDGAGTQVFVANGNKATAVDVNKAKLHRIEGAELVNTDFVSYLNKPVDNIFMHHALEHYSDPPRVLKLISKYIKPGCYCYIAVPRNDTVHDSHFAAFDSLEEIFPPGLEIVESGETEGEWEEYYVIAKA